MVESLKLNNGFISWLLRITVPIVLIHMTVVSSNSLTPDQESSLRDFINALIQCRDNVGMSVSLVRDGEVIFAEGFGYRDLSKESIMLNDTKINIGSITKSFTATLAADTVGRGLTEWNTPLVDILGEDFQLEGPFRTQQASLRDILSHKLGMPNYWGLTTAALSVSREELCRRRLQHFTSEYDFRSRYSYANYGYVLAGYVTEVLTGIPWEQHVSFLFDELYMSDTKQAADLTESDWETNTAYSYTLQQGEFTKNPEEDQLPFLIEANPAGGIFATAHDMGRWMLFHLNKGKNEDGDQIVPESALNELYTFINALTGSNSQVKPDYPVEDTEFAAGMGFMSGTYRGYEKITHSGSYSSYNCRMTMLPSMNVGVWACVNSPGDSRGSTAVSLTNMYALDLLLDKEPWLNETTGCTYPAPWEPDIQDIHMNVDYEVQHKTIQRKPLEDYEGLYGHPGFGIFEIYLNGTDQLRYKFGLLLQGQLSETEDPLQMFMSIEYPLDYRMAFFPSYPNGFPVYFEEFISNNTMQTVEVPYLEFSLPPVFRRDVVP